MEEIIFKFALIFQASSIALGVGSSTLAISSFLTALYDDKIDEGERRMLGVIYAALRVAMVGIVLTTATLYFIDPVFFGAFGVYMWVLIGVLFANAVAMTKHWISPKYGPAIQAGTWYTLGFMATIHMFSLFVVGWSGFFALYAGDVLFAYVVVNGYLWWRKRAKKLQ